MDDLNKSTYITDCVHSKRCEGVAAELRGVAKRMMYLMLKCAVDTPEMFKS
jgi:hypothetical protein